MFIYGPNTTTPTTPHPPTPPHRMTVMTPVKMMNTTLKGTRINQANKKSPECPLTLLANKDIQGLLPLWGVRGGAGVPTLHSGGRDLRAHQSQTGDLRQIGF